MTSAKDKEVKRKVNKDEYNNSFLGFNQLELDQVFSCELVPV